MRYTLLATDYDETLASHGKVAETSIAALTRVRASGRKLVLATGRHLPDLRSVFSQLELFDRVVAENGALLYRPQSREEELLCGPPKPQFVQLLSQRKVPFTAGRGIVATWEPHQQSVLAAIRDSGLDLQVVLNKGSVMVLPAGVNKATGVKVALAELGISPRNVVGIGDAENDLPFLAACGFSAAVANALPLLKERADMVTDAENGAGTVELIEELLADDLASYEARVSPPAISWHAREGV